MLIALFLFYRLNLVVIQNKLIAELNLYF